MAVVGNIFSRAGALAFCLTTISILGAGCVQSSGPTQFPDFHMTLNGEWVHVRQIDGSCVEVADHKWSVGNSTPILRRHEVTPKKEPFRDAAAKDRLCVDDALYLPAPTGPSVWVQIMERSAGAIHEIQRLERPT